MAGLGGRDAMMRNMPAPGAGMDRMWGAPPVRSGPSAIGGGAFDPLVANFSNGPAWGSTDAWDPLLNVNSRGIMGAEAELEETANATAGIPRHYQVSESSSAMLDMNTGEQMLIFEEDPQSEMFFRNREALEQHDIVQDVSSFGSESLSPEELSHAGESSLRRTKPVDHHQQVKPYSLPRLNHLLRSENGRRRFGYMKDARVLQRTFRFAGVQETQLLPEHRTRTEQTMALIIRGRVRFANIWILNGGVPAIGSELFLVFARYKWNGLPKFRWPTGQRGDDPTVVSFVHELHGHERRKRAPFSLPFDSFKASMIGAAVEAERGYSRDFAAGAAASAPIDIPQEKSKGDKDEGAIDIPETLDDEDELSTRKSLSSLSLQPGQQGTKTKRAKTASAAVTKIKGDEHYWQVLPMVAPSLHTIPRRIHNNLNFRSVPIHVGKTLDNYDGDAASVSSQILYMKELNRDALFPADDSDGFKASYYKLPRIEVCLRPVRQMPGCL